MKQLTFDGTGLRVITFRGEPMVIAKDLGAALGYSKDGRRLVGRITEEWSAEFEAGKHYVIIDGQDLAALREVDPESGSTSKFAPSLMLLPEAGVDKVLIKTEKPVGIRLRDFLVDNVMPRLRRGETIQGRSPEVGAKPTAPVLTSAQATLLREARMLARSVTKAGVDPKAAAAWQAGVFQGVTGISTTHLLPHVEPEDEGMLPSEIAAELVREVGPRATEAKVGKVITRLGLRGDPKYSVQVFGKARGHDKTVTPWKYNPAAVALIKPEVRDWVAREQAEHDAAEAKRAAKEESRATKAAPPDDDDLFGGKKGGK